VFSSSAAHLSFFPLLADGDGIRAEAFSLREFALGLTSPYAGGPSSARLNGAEGVFSLALNNSPYFSFLDFLPN